jgi:hypothetical protein
MKRMKTMMSRSRRTETRMKTRMGMAAMRMSRSRNSRVVTTEASSRVSNLLTNYPNSDPSNQRSSSSPVSSPK